VRHERYVIALARIVVQLLADLAGLVVQALRPRRSVEAENLFLRRQLALYLERGAKPRRVDAATRVSLALLSRLFDWRDALIVVRPETLIRWHRAGWRLFWRFKSRPGRPPIPLELRRLIPRMATENPIWGEERIANELLLKLGLRVSPRTVRKYMPARPPVPDSDRDSIFARCLDESIRNLGLTVLKSPPLSESHLRSILRSWVGHYNNHGRPHMALGPGVPDPPSVVLQSATPLTRHRIGERLAVRARSVLGGVHHEYLLASASA